MASWLSAPLPAVRATSVNSPASGSKATWARRPSWWRVRYVPRLGVGGGHRAVTDGPLGDAPAPVAAVGVVGGLHVLARDQGQQPDGVRRGLPEFLLGEAAQQVECVGDQGVDQVGARLLIVPCDLRLAGVGVVVGGAPDGGGLPGVGDLADEPADRGDQLGDGVLGGDRVVQHGGVQRASLPALEDLGGRNDFPDLGEQPVRVTEALQWRRKYVSSDGSNAVSCSPSPHAAFHRRSQRSSCTVSKSESPCRLCSTTVAASTCGGIEGRPFAEGYMSANIDPGTAPRDARPGTRTRSRPGSAPDRSPTRPRRHSPRPISPAYTAVWPRTTTHEARTEIFRNLLVT